MTFWMWKNNFILKVLSLFESKFREILCNLYISDEYHFIFFHQNLIFTAYNNNLLENDFKEYRVLQIIIKNILNCKFFKYQL